MAELDYDALQRLADAATDGPWENHEGYPTGGGQVIGPSGYSIPGCMNCGENDGVYEETDSRFIAASRTAVPALLGRVRELVAERDAALSTIAKVEALHRPVEIEPSDTICGECSYQLPNGHYFGKVEYWPCPTIRALGSVPSTGEGNDGDD